MARPVASPSELAARAARGKLIRDALEARGWSIARLAKAIGIDRGLVSRIVAGKASGSISTLTAISEVLDIDLNLLKSPPSSPEAPNAPLPEGFPEPGFDDDASTELSFAL